MLLALINLELSVNDKIIFLIPLINQCSILLNVQLYTIEIQRRLENIGYNCVYVYTISLYFDNMHIKEKGRVIGILQ
jgi:hypothetical protein